MPRPTLSRRVKAPPRVDYFKPRGVPQKDLLEVYLPLEGYEALRLAEIEGLSHPEAAERMNVSRHTFGRVLSQARRIVAEAVVKGQALRITGGSYHLDPSQAQAVDQAPGRAAPEPRFGEDAEGVFRPESVEGLTIALSCGGEDLDALVDERFGRAPGFIILNLESMEFSFLSNHESQAMEQEAGVNAANLVIQAGAKVVLTGFVGPKAFAALAAAGIGVGENMAGLSVREAARRLRRGLVTAASEPNRG